MLKKVTGLLAAFVILFSGCSENPGSPYTEKYITKSVDPVHANIQNPKERWQAYQLEDYMISYSNNCYCIWGGREFKVAVRNNKIVEVFDPRGEVIVDTSEYNWYRTIDQMFELTESINPDSVYYFRAEYDSLYGFPDNVWVDYDSLIADEEFGFWVGSLEEIIKFN
ncbi:MAG: hypothetical protein D8M58_21230 [Calditrichaeota bacterium]|nr:MAG: hypothetical protein DWQ03_16945 [Calditrichota bacterium]MBL1207936.1 hypothetical protein [Calditrichota bacterium]NOG47771.1 hypothetical protein [Calditrichota bacterium]